MTVRDARTQRARMVSRPECASGTEGAGLEHVSGIAVHTRLQKWFFKTPSDTRWLRCRPLEMLTYWCVCCAFESACALPSAVIRGFETTSMKWLPENAETIHSRSPACQTEKLAPGGNLSLTRGRAALPYACKTGYRLKINLPPQQSDRKVTLIHRQGQPMRGIKRWTPHPIATCWNGS